MKSSTSLQTLLVLGVFALLASLFIFDVHAEISPVQLIVTKSKKTKVNASSSGSTSGRSKVGRTVIGSSTISYHIELANKSTQPLDGLKVKWAVLVKPAQGSAVVRDGDNTFSIEPRGKIEFDTDSWELEKDDNLVGYVIEVSQGDKIIASDIHPPDTKVKISQVKPKKSVRE